MLQPAQEGPWQSFAQFWSFTVLKHVVCACHEQVAQVTLVSLLEAELLQLTSEAQVPQADVGPEQDVANMQVHMMTAYWQATAHVLESQLIKARSLETRPHKKRKSRPSKRKHKPSVDI